MTSIWPRIFVGIAVGGLSVLCIEPGSRPFLQSAWNAPVSPLRNERKLPDPDDLEGATLWAERAALNPATSRDVLLLRQEVAESSREMEPNNRFWTLMLARAQRSLGNDLIAQSLLTDASHQPLYDDHRDLAIAYHVRNADAGPTAWRRIALSVDWPFGVSVFSPTVVTQSVLAACLAGSLLLASVASIIVWGLSEVLIRYGRVTRLASSNWIWVLAGVAGMACFFCTHLIFPSLSATILVGAFGATRERIVHHSRASQGLGWIYGLFWAVSTLSGVCFVIVASPQMAILDATGALPHGFLRSSATLEGVAFGIGAFLALSHVVAYVQRREPVFEWLFHLRACSRFTALLFGIAAVIATPVCIEWDHALSAHVANSTALSAKN